LDLIHKISVGADLKNAMHYIVGNKVVNNRAVIETILYDKETGNTSIYIKDIEREEILLWKTFNKNIPITYESDINFGFNK
jgi:hypothetical protein